MSCKVCKFTFSLFKSELFKNIKIMVEEFLMLVYFFVINMKQDIVSILTGLSTKCVCQFWQMFNKVCSFKLINENFKIGGNNQIVNIDEAVLLKRKYQRGRTVPTVWMLGGYDTLSKKAFLHIVPDRKRDTVIPIIKKYVEEKSIIHTDKFVIYDCLNDLVNDNNEKIYIHRNVNHSENFVDPITGVHTQFIEGFFSKFRTFFHAALRRRE